MKYTINGETFDKRPDPCNGVSPMTDALFKQMGGTIEKGKKEFFLDALDAYLDELEEQAKGLALDLTADDFKAAAGAMMSTELVAWAEAKGVPPDMIAAVRQRILELVADASRIGLTWADIFPKTNERN